jgi:spermidine synthase
MIRRHPFPFALLALLAFAAAAVAEDKVLYEKASAYNKIKVIEDDQGLRTLRFDPDDASQSVVKLGDPDHVELPYAQAMPVGLALVDQPQRVLIIGLGGGTIPSFLRKHYPRTTIDIVDIDPDVVDVAKRFFGFQEDANMHVCVKDGRRFIEECRNPYDMIFLDAYGAENIPYMLTTKEFLQAVRRAVTPKGVVLGNVWTGDSNPLYDSMIRTYQNVFDELYVIDVEDSGNRIFIALPRKDRLTRDDLARQASKVSREQHFRFDLGKFVRSGYEFADKPNTAGRILLDKDKPK